MTSSVGGGMALGKPGTHEQVARGGVMGLDYLGQVKARQVTFLDEYRAVDHRKIHVLRLAKDERGQRVMDGSPGVGGGGEVKGDDIGGLARFQRSDIVATKHGCAA